MTTLISSNVVSPFYIWWGQIVDEVNWITNINSKNHARDDVDGWGPCRCKVRIFGRDTRTKEHVGDDQLEWAEVILPVTAGSGHAGSMQTPNLRQGSYVIGFYKDGINATQPVIFGTVPNNTQTRLFGGDPSENFIPRTGYKGQDSDKPVSTKNIYTEGPSSTFYKESSDSNVNTLNYQDQQKDGARCHHVPKTRECDGPSGEIKGIQLFIKNALALINRIKAEANSFIGAATDLAGQISSVVDETAMFVSNLMKSLMDKMRGYVVNKLNNGIKDLIDKLPPNQTPGANQASEKATDTLQCVFNKIVKGLVGLIKKLLEGIIDKYINAPMCAIENFIASIFSNILGDILNGIKGALGAVTAILGKVADISSQVFGALDILSGILSFLSCDEKPDCTMGEAWSFWGGAKCATENVRANIGKFFSDTLSGLGPSNAPPCNTAAIPCGPPSISITGGGGAGVLGNPIISATGSILGIDFVNGGSGYVAPPNINIVDNCGKGGGSVVLPVFYSGSLPVGLGSTGGTPVGLGSTGTLPVLYGGIPPVGLGTTGGTPVSIGGTGGTPVLYDGISRVSLGGTGGTPVYLGGTGGTPLIYEGLPISAGGSVLFVGGTGGTLVSIAGANLVVGGAGGIPLVIGGTGGTPLVIGDVSGVTGGTGGILGIPGVTGGTLGIPGATSGTSTGLISSLVGTGIVGNTPINIVGTPLIQTLVTDSGIPLTLGGDGGIPVIFDGNPVSLNGNPLNGNSTGGSNIAVGGDGQPITSSNGDPILIDSVGGLPITINGNPVTIGGAPITVGGVGGTPLTSGGTNVGGSIIGAVVLDPGSGYLSAPNGDLGGNGSVWAPNDHTIVQRPDGGFDSPYPPGSSINVNPGDSVQYPGQSPFIVNEPQTITAPPYEPNLGPRGDDPSTSSGSYPVVLTISDVLIANPGVGYLPTDTIQITPDNGAILEPNFNDQGALTGVSIANGGIGFTDFPKITINSTQGINAKLIPVFGVIRVGDLPEDQDIIPPGTGIISVVDCVGRIK